MGLFSKTSKHIEGRPGPPPPPPPPPPPSVPRPNTSKAPQRAPQPPAGTFAIGVEVECLISARIPDQRLSTVEDFARGIASKYTQSIKSSSRAHPGMHNAINESFLGERFSQWSLDKDSTIAEPSPGREPWGLELISPILLVLDDNTWRSHITAVWEVLRTDYRVTANTSCGTHVHMSVAGGYTLSDLQQIASSILHFEPAFEVLLPADRRGNEYTKSNWLDNKNFGYKNVSREAAIAMVQACRSTRDLILLMNPDSDGDHDKFFGWNFLNLLTSTQSTIEFRRGAASTTIVDVFVWIEIALSFLKAGMKLGTPDILKRFPGTVGGLKAFIDAAQLPATIHDRRYLDRLYASHASNAAVGPVPVGRLSAEKAKKLKRKKMEDKQRNIMLAKTLNAPYIV